MAGSKLMPDNAHPQGDVALREDWKKLKERLEEMVIAWGNYRPLCLIYRIINAVSNAY